MRRRTLLGSLGVGAAGGGALLGTGAFTSVEATRTARVEVVGDDAALLALEPADGPNGQYAHLEADGQLALAFTGTDAADGLGPNSSYDFDDVFVVTNQGTQTVELATEVDGIADAEGVDAFRLYDTETETYLDGDGIDLSVGESVTVGVEIRTAGSADEPAELGVTIVAGDTVETPSQGPSIRSATITDEMGREYGEVGPGLTVEVMTQVVPGPAGIETVTIDATDFGLEEPVELEDHWRDDGDANAFAGSFTVGSVGDSPPSTAAVTVTAIGGAGIEDTVESNVLDLVEDPQARWIERATWESLGYATQFPGQVIYPSDSQRVIETLSSFGRQDEVDVRGVAERSADLQVNWVGGFNSYWDDFNGPWVYATHGAVVLANETGVDINEEAAAIFLKNMQRPNGGFSPRYGITGSLIRARMEATALALEALQRLDALDDQTKADAVDFLVTEQNSDGGWPTAVPGAASTAVGTYFALRALDAVGELDELTSSQAGAYLTSLQHPDGGFRTSTDPTICHPSQNPWPTNCEVDPRRTSRSTSHAILGLELTGHLDVAEELSLEDHAEFLMNLQRTDPDDPRHEGAFDTYPERDSVVTDFRMNTHLAVTALDAMDADFDPDSALDFLVRCQHGGSKGFGMEPGYVASIQPTVSAIRALDDRNRLDEVPDDELAARIAREQRDDGAIYDLGSNRTSSGVKTAQSLTAIGRLGKTDGVDVDAAVEYVSSHQKDDGGFGTFVSSVHETSHVVFGLDAVGRLDDIDTQAVAAYLADQQNDDGSISTESTDYGKVRDTRFALEALDALDAVDVVAQADVIEYLESAATVEGEDREGYRISHAIAALGIVDTVDTANVDLEAVDETLREYLLPTGGYALRAFYRMADGIAMERHAAFIAARAVLDDTPVFSPGDPSARNTNSSGSSTSTTRQRPGENTDEPSDDEPVRLEDAGWVVRPDEGDLV